MEQLCLADLVGCSQFALLLSSMLHHDGLWNSFVWQTWLAVHSLHYRCQVCDAMMVCETALCGRLASRQTLQDDTWMYVDGASLEQ